MSKYEELWRSLIAGPCPSPQQFALWEQLHEDSIIVHGIRRAAIKFMKEGTRMEGLHLFKYASSVMNNEARQRSAE